MKRMVVVGFMAVMVLFFNIRFVQAQASAVPTAKSRGKSTVHRFTDNGDQTVTDKITGLVWTKSAVPIVSGSSGCGTNAVPLADAAAYVSCLNSNNYAGKSDWRVPTLKEIGSLCNIDGNVAWIDKLGGANRAYCNTSKVDLTKWLIQQGFTGVQTDRPYWTSTHWTVGSGDSQATAISAVWAAVLMDNSGVFVVGRPADLSVWPVRGGH
jgi:hypothetical protein